MYIIRDGMHDPRAAAKGSIPQDGMLVPGSPVAEGGESPASLLGQHAALGLLGHQQHDTFMEHKSSAQPWERGCDVDRQGSPWSVLYSSVSPFQVANKLVHRQTDKPFRSYDAGWREAPPGFAWLASEW